MSVSCFVELVGSLKEGLRRDATNVQAGSSERRFFLYTSGFQAELGGFDGGHVATWTGADYGDIDVVVGSSSGGGGEASRGDSGEHVLSWCYDFSEKLDFYEKMKKIKNKNKLQSCVHRDELIPMLVFIVKSRGFLTLLSSLKY